MPTGPGKHPTYQGENLTFADEFQSVVRGLVLNLPTLEQPRSAVYSSACFLHCTSTLVAGAFWGVKVDGVALKDYLGAWYYGGAEPSFSAAGAASIPAPLTKQHIESCTGFGCGACHSKTVGYAPPLPPAYQGLPTVLVPGGAPLTSPRSSSVLGRRSGAAGAGGNRGAREVEHALGIAIAALLTCAAMAFCCGGSGEKSGGGGGATGGPKAPSVLGGEIARVRPGTTRAKGGSGVELGTMANSSRAEGEASPLLLRIPITRK